MSRKIFTFFLISILFLSFLQINPSIGQAKTQIWKTQRNYFHYNINVVETLSDKQSVGFQVDIIFTYLGIQSNNETRFEIQAYSTLANYAGTETATGFENVQTRLMNVNLTNAINIQRVFYYFGFSSNAIYNPFVIPIDALKTHQNVFIWTYNHTFLESSHYDWLGVTRNVSVYQFKNSQVVDTGYYDNEFGILFYDQFMIQSGSRMFNATVKLIGTSLQLFHGTVPLLNYVIALGLCLVIPGAIILFYYGKKYKSKRIDSGGLK